MESESFNPGHLLRKFINCILTNLRLSNPHSENRCFFIPLFHPHSDSFTLSFQFARRGYCLPGLGFENRRHGADALEVVRLLAMGAGQGPALAPFPPGRRACIA